MTVQTPLGRLSDAIHAFFEETNEIPGSFVTAWVVAASTARIQSDDDTALPMVSGARYVLGPETSTVQAAGLARFLDVVVEKATWSMLSDDDEE